MKQTIAVIFGGRSTEHDVSIITALSAVIKPLEVTQKYNILPIYITKTGQWYSDSPLGKIETFTNGSIDDKLAKLKQCQLSFENGLEIIIPGFKSKKTHVDLVFPAMHGTYGEDGSLMGLLRMANVPFVGCDMAGSAIAMDKVTSKLLAQARGLPITKMEVFTSKDFEEDSDSVEKTVIKNLKFPVFVKPAHMGSSIGLTRVDDKKDLFHALEVAFHYDASVLVEEGVANLIEVTLPIMGNDELIPAMLEQPMLGEDGVFDFETKYMQGGKKGGKKGGAKSGDADQGAQGYSIIPAKLDKKLYDKAMQVGLDSFRALGLDGYARVDLLIDGKTEEVYFNEVNPLPGSLYAHNWRKAGYTGVELVEKLIALAVERHQKDNASSVTFETSFLEQF